MFGCAKMVLLCSWSSQCKPDCEKLLRQWVRAEGQTVKKLGPVRHDCKMSGAIRHGSQKALSARRKRFVMEVCTKFKRSSNRGHATSNQPQFLELGWLLLSWTIHTTIKLLFLTETLRDIRQCSLGFNWQASLICQTHCWCPYEGSQITCTVQKMLKLYNEQQVQAWVHTGF